MRSFATVGSMAPSSLSRASSKANMTEEGVTFSRRISSCSGVSPCRAAKADCSCSVVREEGTIAGDCDGIELVVVDC